MDKESGRTKFLARKAQFLDAGCFKLLANSLVSCCLDYMICTWYGGLTKELKHRLQISRDKLIRMVLGLGPRDHAGKQQFQQLGWLPLEARAVQLQLRMVHDIYNNRAPEYLKDHFQEGADLHVHHTRASIADLCLPRFKPTWENVLSSFAEQKTAMSYLCIAWTIKLVLKRRWKLGYWTIWEILKCCLYIMSSFLLMLLYCCLLFGLDCKDLVMFYDADAVWLLGLFAVSLSSFYNIMDHSENKPLTLLCLSMTIWKLCVCFFHCFYNLSINETKLNTNCYD